MRFLVDAALSPVIAAELQRAGHDAVHVADYGMLGASDADVLARGLDENRVVISADTDFAMLLATREETRPSLVLLRSPARSPAKQVDQILGSLAALQAPLEEGAIGVIEESRVRIRSLPINETKKL